MEFNPILFFTMERFCEVVVAAHALRERETRESRDTRGEVEKILFGL